MRLANGQRWYLTGTQGAMPWLERLASVMELKACDGNGDPKLIFTRGEAPIRFLALNIRANLPKRGWKARDFRALQIWSHREVSDVICDIGHGEGYELEILRMWQSLDPIFQRAQYTGGLPFHAALVERNGMGVLLAGSANKGKSTCCRRLQGPWQFLCDDETLVVRDEHKRYLAQPFPTWSDYLFRRSEPTWNVQRHLPLSAIFFLEHAETDDVVPMGEGQTAALVSLAAAEICRRSWMYMDRGRVRALRKKLFDNACELARAVPAFVLRVSLKGRFWEEMEKVLDELSSVLTRTTNEFDSARKT